MCSKIRNGRYYVVRNFLNFKTFSFSGKSPRERKSEFIYFSTKSFEILIIIYSLLHNLKMKVLQLLNSLNKCFK